ncbi:peptidoglycan-associated lipoprotein Pal [Candidatus Blochmannia vicinus]|uniref:Peptidoglycan-associated lipoprotein n=1 Tax=Candidatus Blochmannia vicinus (nom. nud.) TaxID=251540 RepID=A0ABY4T1L3_9ENTR|nr:peptidoglycan-associated lipoprotein Pal [Candidatus Blochmannia vicinus]URJ33315.1 peptidoglycan-associated lipoprotein Pal [Candidatus Blochmannia vicinus]
MKLNNFFKQLTFAVSISIIITACSVFPKHTIINDKKKMELNPFTQINTKNNKIIDEKLELETQELKSNNIIYFSLDQYDISSQFFYTLNIHANFLYNHPLYRIKIEGHADERGTPEYNIALGERRANSIKLYLQSKGILPEQIFTVSYGKEKPAVPGHNEAAYSKNRRAVLIYK